MTANLLEQSAVIAGTFTEYRMVKTRSAFQLIVEIPIERQAEAFAALGYPVPGTDIHVAVARLNSPAGKPQPPDHERTIVADTDGKPKPQSRPAGEPKERRPWETLSPQQQAGILCADKGFQKWAGIQAGWDDYGEEEAASWLRGLLGIESRRELAKRPGLARKLGEIRAEFLEWAGRVPAAPR